MQRSREFLNTPAGKAVGAAGGAVCLLLLAWSLWPTNPTAEASNKRVFIDAETKQTYKVTLEQGLEIPAKAPSGKKTGYPAEMCWWTRDGQVRKEPYPVLLKRYVDPNAGPTFCPDCGRLVVGHNPEPVAGKPPPPTEEEYMARRGNRAAAESAASSR